MLLSAELEPVRFRMPGRTKEAYRANLRYRGDYLYSLHFFRVRNAAGFAGHFKTGDIVAQIHIHSNPAALVRKGLLHLQGQFAGLERLGLAGLFGDSPNRALLRGAWTYFRKVAPVRLVRPPAEAELDTNDAYASFMLLSEAPQDRTSKKFIFEPVHRLIIPLNGRMVQK